MMVVEQDGAKGSLFESTVFYQLYYMDAPALAIIGMYRKGHVGVGLLCLVALLLLLLLLRNGDWRKK